MDNFTPTKSPKRKYTAAIITVIICAAIVGGAVSFAILFPDSEIEIIPPFIKDTHQRIHFSEIKYVRPDTDGIIADINTLISMINDGKSFTEQSTLFNKISDEIKNFNTMYNIAYINYSADISVKENFDEYFLLKEKNVELDSKKASLTDTIAQSSYKTNYERSYYGVGYFTDYKPATPSPELEALLKKEVELITKYSDITSNKFVEYKGTTIYLSNIYSYSLSYDEMVEVTDLINEKYKAQAGEIYVDLVKTRLAIAQEAGTDYLSYVYKLNGRGYTPTEGKEYLDNFAKNIVPEISALSLDYTAFEELTDPSFTLYAVADAARNMKGIFSEAFNYMFNYGFYNVGGHRTKASSSFVTMLQSYNAPFLFVSSEGTVSDFHVMSHEFGHYVDGYKNPRFEDSVDILEIPSTTMSFLMPYYTDALFGCSQKDLISATIASSAESFCHNAYLSRFEHEVYSLSPEEVTVERINKIAYDAAVEFGFEASAEVFSHSWHNIGHLFLTPSYCFSYLISTDLSLQILEIEKNAPGKGGIETLTKLINRNRGVTLDELIKDCDLRSPFDEENSKKIATLIKDIITSAEVHDPIPGESSAIIPTDSPVETPAESTADAPAESTALPAA